MDPNKKPRGENEENFEYLAADDALYAPMQ